MIINTPKPSDIPALRALWKTSFGDTDEYLDLFFSVAFSEQRCLAAMEGDELIASLYWFDCLFEEKRLAYVYAVSTAPSQRGRGVCRELMSSAHSHLYKLGYSAVILVPAEPSLYGFYERLGYSVCSKISEIKARITKKEGCQIKRALTEISPTEYRELRKKYLPQHGVIQDAAALEMLGAEMALYKGDGFILAANSDGDELHCRELLGVAEPEEILCALGAKLGTFRTPTSFKLKEIPPHDFKPQENSALVSSPPEVPPSPEPQERPAYDFKHQECSAYDFKPQERSALTEITIHPFAMGYPLDGEPLGECYFGIALD